MAKQQSQSVKESPKHKSLAHAVLAVMEEVEWIEKNSAVGSGNNSYKGIKDEDVKAAFNKAFVKHGLISLPVEIEDNIRIDRWEEENNWNGKITIKQKQSVFTSVKTKYELIHADSGESKIIVGYGHGIDPQDKGAGKATTYALKYSLLYSFLNPAGRIDDADNTHSDDHEIPKKNNESSPNPTSEKNSKPEPQKPSGKAEEAIKKIVAALDNSKTKEELAGHWKNVPPALKKVDRILRAKEAKKAEFETAKAS